MSQFNSGAATPKWSSLQLLAGQSFLAGFTLALLYAVANTRFLLDYGPEMLPQAYVVAAIFIPTVSLFYNRYARRVTERRLLLTVTLIICATYLFSWLAATSDGARWISFALLVIFNTLFVFQVVIITLQASNLFDIRQMKSSYPLVLASQTGAVIIGGLSVTLLADLIGGVGNLLLMCLLLSSMQFVLTWLTMNRFPKEFGRNVEKRPATTLRDVLAAPYARHIFLYRFFSGFGTELIIIIFTIQAARRFQTAAGLAAFFGNFMAAGTFVTLLFLLLVAGRLLKRYGLRFGIMSNPLLAGLIVLGLFLSQFTPLPLATLVFILAVTGRVLDFVFSVSITEPALKTMYQALPEQSRPALITVVEAVSQPLGYGVVGGTLLLFQAFNLDGDSFLFSYTALVCVVWAYFGWRTYRLYSGTLRDKLNQRTLPGVELTIDDPATAAVVAELARSENPTRVRLALNLLAQADHSDYAPLLLSLLNHAQEAVRLDAMARLERLPAVAAAIALETYLEPPHTPAFRAAALQTILATGHEKAFGIAVNALHAPELPLRRASLIGLLRHGGIAGQVEAGRRLLELAASSREEDQLLLAQTLAELDHHNFHQPLTSLLRSESSAVRRYALQAAQKAHHPRLLPAIITQLDTAATRSLAMDALATYGKRILPYVEAALAADDVDPARRFGLVRLAGQLPAQEGCALLVPYLGGADRALRQVLLATVARSGYHAADGEAAQQIAALLAAEVQYAAVLLAAAAAFAHSTAFARLHSALCGDYQRTVVRILLLLALRYDTVTLPRIAVHLQNGSDNLRAQAVETVDLILSPAHKQLVLPLIDGALSAGERLAALGKWAPAPVLAADEWLTKIIGDSEKQFDDWTQACAIHAAAVSDDPAWRVNIAQFAVAHAGAADRPVALDVARWGLDPAPGENKMLIIEKVSLLQETDIFKDVPAAVLAAVAQVATVVTLPAHEQFIHEGDLAGDMYIIVEGAVRVQKNGNPIIELRPGETVGELAIFDQAPRSADVVTLQPSVLLQIEKQTLQDVMADRPEISSGIIQSLSRRIRAQGDLLAG